MITYQQESLFEILDEMKEIIKLNYRDLTLNKDNVLLDPIWERYENLESTGNFFLFTARDDLALVGYGAFFLNNHIHYRDLNVASNDVLYLKEEYRKGMTGIKLLKFCENKMKELGADKITWHVKNSIDFTPILYRLGYLEEDKIIGKFL